MRKLLTILLVTICLYTKADPPYIFVCGVDSVQMLDGKWYRTVLLGSQCWFAKNLNCGTMISNTVEQTNNATVEKWCYNNDEANCTTYGGYYEWWEMMNYDSTTTPKKGICPSGWHIPSLDEWYTLINYEKGIDSAAYYLNEDGWVHWKDDLAGHSMSAPVGCSTVTQPPLPTPESFNLRGNGNILNGSSAFLRQYSSTWTSTYTTCYQYYLVTGNNAYLYCSTDDSNPFPVYIKSSKKHQIYNAIPYINQTINSGFTYQSSGMGVRCLKDPEYH